MIQIGPVKYIKKEENTILESILSGFLFGIPSGLLLIYSAGLLKRVTPAADDAVGWTAVLLEWCLIFVATCWTTAIITSILVSRRNGFESKRQIGKMVFGTVLVPLAWILAGLVAGLVATPIDAFLYRSFGITHTHAIDALIFAPFVVLSVSIIVPNSRPGKALRGFIGHRRALTYTGFMWSQ